jgi:ribonuclease HII
MPFLMPPKKTPLKHPPATFCYVAGCDEAGRGCLAGPVFAAAVVLPAKLSPDLEGMLNDSKQLSASQRNFLRPLIEKESLGYAVAMVDNAEIDKINILQASILCMHHALKKLDPQPDFILVDGNRFIPYGFVPGQCIVKGDGKYLCIAAASVLAKTWRDDYMLKLHTEYPDYGWDKNKGYPTEEHRKAIGALGHTKYHRMTFRS